MKNLTLRIDENFEHEIRKKAAQKNIKFTRYLRSLIDKGLAVEMQLEAMVDNKLMTENKKAFDLRLAEMLVENLIYSRKLIEVNSTLSNEAQSIFLEAQRNSKKYIAKINVGNDIEVLGEK